MLWLVYLQMTPTLLKFRAVMKYPMGYTSARNAQINGRRDLMWAFGRLLFGRSNAWGEYAIRGKALNCHAVFYHYCTAMNWEQGHVVFSCFLNCISQCGNTEKQSGRTVLTFSIESVQSIPQQYMLGYIQCFTYRLLCPVYIEITHQWSSCNLRFGHIRKAIRPFIQLSLV